MKKVLWFSRHQMSPAQEKGMEKLLGDTFEVKQIDKTASSGEEVAELGSDCDVLAVVLPTSMMADLFRHKKEDQVVCSAKSKRKLVPSKDGGESKVVFLYDGWEVFDKFDVESHVVL